MVDTADINPLFKARLDKFLAAAKQAGYPGDIISGYRTNDEQAALYDKYQHGGNIAAPPGTSMHNYGLAVDLSGNIPALDKFAADHPEYGIYNNAKADADHFQMFPWGTHAQDAANTVAGWKGTDPGTGTAIASATPGTTLNSTPAPATAAPTPAPQQNTALAQGAQEMMKGMGGGNAPPPQPMQVPNLQAHQGQISPEMLQAMMMQSNRPYGLSLGGGGPFQDTQGQGYA
jgi:hypothetical protein